MSRFSARQNYLFSIISFFFLIAFTLWIWKSAGFYGTSSIKLPIYREFLKEEIIAPENSRASVLSENQEVDLQWLKNVLMLARTRGWAHEKLARRFVEFNVKEIDGQLKTLISSDDGAYFPEAFQLLAIIGIKLEGSSVNFKDYLKSRLRGEFPLDASYAGYLATAIVAAVSRLAHDGDPWMRQYLDDIRVNGVFSNIEKNAKSSELMFRVICGYAPYCPTEDTIAYLESTNGRYEYAQRRIELIRNYQKSGDRYQDYIFELTENSPGKNKYISEFIPLGTAGDLPSTKAKIIKEPKE